MEADTPAGGQLLPPTDPWQPWTPTPRLAPRFTRTEDRLELDGGGNAQCFGAWCRTVPARPGTAYRLTVAGRVGGRADLALHLTPHVVWRRGELPEDHCAEDAIRRLEVRDGQFGGQDTFVAPANCDAAEIRLLLRYAPQARVSLESVTWTPAEPPPPRRLRVGVMSGRPPGDADAEGHRGYYLQRVEQLAAQGAELILLPEFANCASRPLRPGAELLAVAEPLDGPFGTALAAAARRHGCYLAAGLLERDDDLVFNTAVLLDGSGQLVGRQRKVHPYWPEEPLGVLPGDDFQTLAIDRGVVGIMICYDSWWPESARLLALQGADLLLFPNAGYEERILPARAIDNNVYVACSSLGSPATILSPRGEALATATAPGVACVEIDLADRPRCHPNAGGNLNGGPGGGLWVRNARSTWLYEEILRRVRGASTV